MARILDVLQKMPSQLDNLAVVCLNHLIGELGKSPGKPRGRLVTMLDGKSGIAAYIDDKERPERGPCLSGR